MKNNLVSGQTVFFFFSKIDAGDINNHHRIAPAVIVGRPWTSTTCNLKVLLDNTSDTRITSVINATSLSDALQGGKFATASQCSAWGVDISDAHQDLDALLAPAETATATASADNSAHSFTEGSDAEAPAESPAQ